jgi:hypothetical protein
VHCYRLHFLWICLHIFWIGLHWFSVSLYLFARPSFLPLSPHDERLSFLAWHLSWPTVIPSSVLSFVHFCRLMIQLSTAVFSPTVQSSLTSDTSCQVAEWHCGGDFLLGIWFIDQFNSQLHLIITPLLISKLYSSLGHMQSPF